MSMYGVVYEGLDVGSKSRTKQSGKEECDINNIVATYVRTGLATHLAAGVPQFLDVSEVGDYRTALENVRAADKYFLGLPAAVRAEFQNDPALFIEALQDPNAAERIREIGIEVLGDPRAPARDRREGDVIEPPEVIVPLGAPLPPEPPSEA